MSSLSALPATALPRDVLHAAYSDRPGVAAWPIGLHLRTFAGSPELVAWGPADVRPQPADADPLYRQKTRTILEGFRSVVTLGERGWTLLPPLPPERRAPRIVAREVAPFPRAETAVDWGLVVTNRSRELGVLGGRLATVYHFDGFTRIGMFQNRDFLHLLRFGPFLATRDMVRLTAEVQHSPGLVTVGRLEEVMLSGFFSHLLVMDVAGNCRLLQTETP